MEARIRKVAGRPLTDFVSSNQIKAFDGDVLVIHAPDDREVGFTEAAAMARGNPHVTLKAFDGLGHRRIITDAGVFAAIREFATEKGTTEAAA
jgi:pimeloyl-ACP methyl ester carboxylesterase